MSSCAFGADILPVFLPWDAQTWTSVFYDSRPEMPDLITSWCRSRG